MNENKIYEAVDFESISYGPKLQAEFERLGIPQAWKPGKRKSELIQNAIDLLAEMRAAQLRGLTVEEYQAKLLAEIDEIDKNVEITTENDEMTAEIDENVESDVLIPESKENVLDDVKTAEIDGIDVVIQNVVEKAGLTEIPPVIKPELKKMPVKQVKAPVIVAKPQFTKEVLIENIQNIDANIAFGPEGHRDTLLKKKEQLEIMLEYYK